MTTRKYASGVTRVEDDHPDWRLLASVDESESYDVDISEIWQKADGTFVLVTASGCSCWDGGYDTDDYPTLKELRQDVLTARNGAWNPSFRAAAELFDEAMKALGDQYISVG